MSFKMRCICNIICTYLSKMSRRIDKKMVNSGCSEEGHQWLVPEMEGRLFTINPFLMLYHVHIYLFKNKCIKNRNIC